VISVTPVAKNGRSDHGAEHRTEAGITAEDLARLVYGPAEIEQRAKAVYCRALAESETLCPGNDATVRGSDLRLLFALYDEYFLNGVFGGTCPERVGFRISNRMTRSAGMVTYRDRNGPYTVSLSGTLLLEAFTGPDDSVLVNGLVCRDRLEATMRVLEHEIVHLLELVAFGTTSCARARFRRLSRGLFGHTDVTHGLANPGRRHCERCEVKPGDIVRFRHRGRVLWGTVSRVTKRATVMVSHPRGTHLAGTGDRYSKFYVPLRCLE
jgi:hypothetical protein